MTSQNEFITTPEITLPNGRVFAPIQVGKYLSGKGEDGKVVITASAKPWVRVSQIDAIAASKASGLKLIAESLYVAIAYDISRQAINWTSGVVGEGSLFQGLHKGSVRMAKPGDYESKKTEERRWFKLSNGERIYDFAGNAYSWTFDDVQGNEDGVVASPFAADSISISMAPAESGEKGVGWFPSAGADWSGRALVRGGCWDSGGYAGAFGLASCWPGVGVDGIGFRCTK